MIIKILYNAHMIPAALITFREVIEATLIVATILGVLYKLNQKSSIKIVWSATGLAVLVSIGLLAAGSIFGFKIQEAYSGQTEKMIEGMLMMVSALFITWAVFFLHNYFAQHKIKLLQKIKNSLDVNKQRGLFILVFTAVFREGFEIVLFLSTIYFASNPAHIFTGFATGIIAGLVVSFAFFSATLKMPVYWAFRVTSILLILFAAGLLARGVHEFAEVGFIPEMGGMIFAFIPAKGTIAGDIIKSLFGITQKMDYIQATLYTMYTACMTWYVFFRKSPTQKEIAP